MRTSCYLHVPGGNTYSILKRHVQSLQNIAIAVDALTFPLLLRLGGRRHSSVQPITAKSLLDEIQRLKPDLSTIVQPGMLLRDATGTVLGGLYGELEDHRTGLSVTQEGIRLVVDAFPPPPGFRSLPGLRTGLYACFFRQILLRSEGPLGIRTAEMGGSSEPVGLPAIALPPVTQWDVAHVAGQPEVAVVEWVEMDALEIYRDALHGLEAACTESLRLMKPLDIRFD